MKILYMYGDAVTLLPSFFSFYFFSHYIFSDAFTMSLGKIKIHISVCYEILVLRHQGKLEELIQYFCDICACNHENLHIIAVEYVFLCLWSL